MPKVLARRLQRLLPKTYVDDALPSFSGEKSASSVASDLAKIQAVVVSASLSSHKIARVFYPRYLLKEDPLLN